MENLEMPELKKSLRKKLIEQRKAEDAEYSKKADDGIFRNITAMPEFISAETIFVFVSVDGEVDTRRLISHAIKNGKRVVVPKCLKFGIMETREIKGEEDLVPGKYDIPEPRPECRNVPKNEIDFAVVPCLACDMSGMRIGYGGGFYDRFLGDRDMICAAVCKSRYIIENIPSEDHDEPVDFIISEKGVYKVAK